MLFIIIGGVAFLVIAVIIFAKSKHVYPIGLGWHNEVFAPAELAIRGYDAVSYHIQGQAQKGSEQYQTNWKGSKWYFSSNENKQAFESNPEQFAPKFGGYCSFAVSKGFTANVNPEVWHINSGDLYLFDSQDVKETWVSQIPEGVIDKCNKNWN